MGSITLKVSSSHSKKAAVISHERSGTHFLMNSLALNFDYISNPWWNFDFEQGLNFHAPQTLLNYFKQVDNKPVLNILKSHHPFEFFSDIIDYLCDQFFIFYIYRDPRDIMVSNWKLINYYHTLGWDEGPKSLKISDFIRSAPCGNMLRYQKKQEPTVLHRWQSHVEGWLNYAETCTNGQVMTLRYEDLNLKFDETMRRVATYLGHPEMNFQRPSKDGSVIKPGKGKVNSYRDYFDSSDTKFVLDSVGDTMSRLGYL